MVLHVGLHGPQVLESDARHCMASIAATHTAFFNAGA